MTAERDEVAYAMEVLVAAIATVADGKPDDELVPIGWMTRQLFDLVEMSDETRARLEPGIAEVEDQWEAAGVVRQRTRDYLALIASGEAVDEVMREDD